MLFKKKCEVKLQVLKRMHDFNGFYISGAPYVYESLLNCRFRVSPAAFFQTNSAGAEVLYRTIGEVAQLDEQSLLLDICCGTGTIGICLAKSQKILGSVGIEMIKEAVDDARINAQANKVDHLYVN